MMEYLHTMVRIANIEQSLDFYCNKMGFVEVHRYSNEKGRYTVIFLAADGDVDAFKTKGRAGSGFLYRFDKWNFCLTLA